MQKDISRRQMIKKSGAAGLAVGLTASLATASSSSKASTDTAVSADPSEKNKEPFRYCLNLATIGAHGLTLPETVTVAAKAGYSGVEPWMGEIKKFVAGGGSLGDLKKQIADEGICVESAIGFGKWAVDDDAVRADALESIKRDMDMLAKIGGIRIAAPPSGLDKERAESLDKVAERYRAVLKLGRKMGVLPQLEVWGFTKMLSTLSEAIYVAIETDDPDACILLDVFHLKRGGSGFAGLRLINGGAMHCFHINDFPTEPSPDVKGSARVMPGDGVAPLDQMYRDLYATGFRGTLSLELFNSTYHKMTALEAAKIGIQKTRASVIKALGSQP